MQTTSASVNRGGEGSSESYQVTSRDLMTAGELLRLAPDKMILFMRGRFPSMLNKVGWFENKHFKPMIQEKLIYISIHLKSVQNTVCSVL